MRKLGQPDHWHGCLGKFALERVGLVSRSMATRLLDFYLCQCPSSLKYLFDHIRIHIATWTVLMAEMKISLISNN
jgi:hypothetical protein